MRLDDALVLSQSGCSSYQHFLSGPFLPLSHFCPLQVADLRRDEALRLPESLDYSKMQLSAEDREKLSAARPSSLAAAQRIPGVTPAALLMLLQHVRKRQPRGSGGSGSSGEAAQGEGGSELGAQAAAASGS